MRRTKRGGWPYSQPPNVPFEVNKASPQSVGLEAWWPFWQPGYTTCPPRWILTPHGTPDRVMTTRGPAVGFNFVDNEYLDLAVPVVIDEPLSMTLWWNPVGATTYDTYRLVSISEAAGQDGWTLQAQTQDPATTVNFKAQTWDQWGTDNANSGNLTGINDWIHLAAVFHSATDRRIYVGGLWRATDVNARSPASADLDVTTIGAWQSGGGVANYAQGYLSDIRFYSRGLTDAEIYEHYANPWELYKPLVPWTLGMSPAPAVRIPRYGFTNFQVPGIV